jgi:hypothetical protein
VLDGSSVFDGMDGVRCVPLGAANVAMIAALARQIERRRIGLLTARAERASRVAMSPRRIQSMADGIASFLVSAERISAKYNGRRRSAAARHDVL